MRDPGLGLRFQGVDRTIVIPGHRAAVNPESRSNYCEIPRCAIAHLRSGHSDHPGMTALEHLMQFDTKIAVVIRTDLEAWQKLNVASFLAGGIAATFPECIGEPYEDGSGTKYLSLIGQPILIYGADRVALTRALERALARNVKPAVYTEEMFRTTHDAANREVVKAVIRAELNLVGLAMRAERKVIDKIVDGLKFQIGRASCRERV